MFKAPWATKEFERRAVSVVAVLVAVAGMTVPGSGYVRAQPDDEAVGPPTSTGTVANSLVFPQISPGEVAINIKQTVAPSRVSPGERVRVVREVSFSLPGAGRGQLCLTIDTSLESVSYGVFLEELDITNFHLYPVGAGGRQFIDDPGVVVPGQIVSERDLGSDVVEDACQTVSRLELIGEFAPTEPGAFYLSLGAVSVGSVQFNEAEVSLPSTGYQVHGQLPIVEVEQLSSEEALNRAVEICVRENAGDSRVPWNEPKVYRQLERDICAAALRFGISPILLAALLQHEGSGRTRWIQGSADKWIEENVNPFGQNETIGPRATSRSLYVLRL